MARSRESGKSRISHGLLDEVMLVQMRLCAGDDEAVDEYAVITNGCNIQKITKRLKPKACSLKWQSKAYFPKSRACKHVLWRV